MAYRPNKGRTQQIKKAVDGGLTAAGNFVANDVRRRFRERGQGYIDGEFASIPGGVHAQITVSQPFVKDDKPSISIGTNARSPKGFPYPLAWELGFSPAPGVFSPGLGMGRLGPTQFRRVETFRPALDENRDKLREIFNRVAKKLMHGGTS